MTTSPTPPGPQPHPIFGREEVDLRQLAHALWRYRLTIVVLGLLGAAVGLALSFVSTRFVSAGLFLTPDLAIGTYKQYEVSLGNHSRVEEFLRLNGLEGKETAMMLRALVRRPGAMAEAVRPAFSLTGRDAKTYDIQIPVTPETAGELVGIHLTMERTEKRGDAPVLALAEYVRSTIVLVDLRELLIDQCLDHQLKEQELRNEQLKSEFQLTQLEAKAENLRGIIDATPGASSIDGRQVVSIENGAERYLSPTTQLVATEVAMSDVRLADIQRARDRVAALLKKDFYCRARTALEQPTTGRAMLAMLQTLRDEVFAEQDPASDIVEQTANELDLQRRTWTDRYLERMRFVVSPEGAEVRERSPSLRVGVLVGGVLGGLLGILLALALAWWHDNRDVVLAQDDE